MENANLKDYTARLKSEPFEGTKSDDWKISWLNAN